MSNIKLFESKKIRSQWNVKEQKWYFSVVDIIAVLTESPRPRKYWNALKTKLQEEGSGLSQNMGHLKMEAEDGKMRMTDVADTEQLLRLIQSIPSPKAEPFKQWLAKVGYERIEETQDPEKSIDRAMENYLKLGYSKEWINQRLKSIEIRKELTDEWENRGERTTGMTPPRQAFISFNFFCNPNISSRSRAASIKSRSRAAFSISFLTRPIAFSNCGMV
jgi:hypothetical protein